MEIADAKRHLEKAGREYYECISASTPESLVDTRRKIEPLLRFTPNARKVVSIGVGNGEEIHVLKDLFTNPETQVIGLDLSRTAINIAKDRINKNNLRAELIQGSGIEMPFKNESIDGMVMSAILHEIYSYVPDGRNAWRKAIREVAEKITDDGTFLLRDFAAPQIPGNVTLSCNTDIATNFYNYFTGRYRTFEGWSEQSRDLIRDKRNSNDPDYPDFDANTRSVMLPYAHAAEILLHFRNFWSDYQAGLTTIGNPDWKEIDEAYLVPDPHITRFQAMAPFQYLSTVIVEANRVLQTTNYEMVCVQNETSDRPETNSFLARHFTLYMPGVAETNEQMIGNVTKKMELVFKKIRKS